MNGQSNETRVPPIKVLQFICPTGYYGAECCITALINNTDPKAVTRFLVVTDESDDDVELDLCLAVERLGTKVHKIPKANRFDFRAIFALEKLIQKENIDVLHTHGYKSAIIGVLAAKLAGVASVSTPHCFKNTKDIKLRLFIALGNFSLRFFDNVAPLSEPLARDVARMGVKPGCIEFIPNGVDLKDIDGGRENLLTNRKTGSLGSEKTARTLGYIGQLISRKNVGDLVTVFTTLADSDETLRLLIVGDGDERAQLEEQANQSNHASKIEFRGFVSDSIPIYVEIDIFSMSSTLEEIPRCLMEAIAVDVPIVAYDIPGVNDLLTHEMTGILVPFSDTAQMVQVCERLLRDDTLYTALRYLHGKLCMSNFRREARLPATVSSILRCWHLVKILQFHRIFPTGDYVNEHVRRGVLCMVLMSMQTECLPSSYQSKHSV